MKILIQEERHEYGYLLGAERAITNSGEVVRMGYLVRGHEVEGTGRWGMFFSTYTEFISIFEIDVEVGEKLISIPGTNSTSPARIILFNDGTWREETRVLEIYNGTPSGED